MLRIVFPIPYVHVPIGVLPEPVPIEAPLHEAPLIADAAILHKHPEAMVPAVSPLTLVVLALMLPHVDAVAVEVVFGEFSFIAVVALLEEEHAETLHHGRLLRGGAGYFTDVLPVGLIEAEFLKVRLMKDLPRPPVLITHPHVLIVLSKCHMQLDHVELGLLPAAIEIAVPLLVIRVFTSRDPRAVHKRYQPVCHAREQKVGDG